ncbi:adenosine 3'-phospho 5'-phosphosulfate transporter 1 [Sitophilus oryzae]|uniref:Adenosine 3'-phospho 5'-phosphosulfate transporter 1 n=1 Tax=Sitophilus oryzae TaxID=7048 RepID=A0A6J2XHL6_SITOR|nr:adenosine 3'-phospho 5'-phosphosulfate transporter 1 [Sitophilus oryzae]
MARNIEILIIIVTIIGIIFFLLINVWILNISIVQDPPENFIWVIHGLRNVLGYGTIFIPGYVIYKYVIRTNYLNKSGRGPIGGIMRTCFGEDELLLVNPNIHGSKTSRTVFQDAVLLLFYFFGLQISYLSWGVLQEKVMTQKYENSNGEEGIFKDSQFLVFVNRILAFAMSAVVLICTRQPRHRCPLYKYVFCSFSNIMSSWCQYEALKYVSFPHQVLAKASKTIPVMIMGKIISKTKYEFYEYVTAVILSVGMLFFMLDSGNDRATSTVTTFSGVILLCSYIAFDSFTSNWQGKLFKTYEMKPIQMMCFVNFFSCIFTLVSLLQHGGLLESFKFMFAYPQFIVDVTILSVCSASGQMFIFCTIDTFGPLVFVIISTIRQCLSVLLSCIIYHHQVNIIGGVGLFLVFFSILLKIYCGYRIKMIKLQNSNLIKN